MDSLEASNEEKPFYVSSDFNIPPVVHQEDIVSSIIDYVYRLWSNRSTKMHESQTLLFSFALDLDKIKEIEAYAIESLNKLPLYSPNKIFFDGEVSYKDLSSENYDTLEELIKYAGKKESIATNLYLNWKAFLKDPTLETAYITIKFHTDVEEDLGSLNFFKVHIAYIEYDIGGHERDWITATAHNVNNILKSTHLSNIFKPLMLFRNKDVVLVVSYSLGALVQVFSFDFLNYLETQGPKNITSHNILKAPDILTKFNLYIQYSFSQQSFFTTVMTLAVSLSLMYLVIVLGLRFLPKLVPRSGILIGHEKRKYDDYINIFKFIVFTIIFGTIGGVILNLITNYISSFR